MSKVALQGDVCYNGGRNIVVSRDAVNTSRLIHLVGDAPMNTLPPHAPKGKVFIYILNDPETKEIRYVGKTDRPQYRYKQHLKSVGHSHRSYWIQSLLRKNLQPEMQIIEEVPSEHWIERERYWIAYYREQGYSLVNATDGGDGAVNPTPQSLARRAYALRKNNMHHRVGESAHQQHRVYKFEERASARNQGVRLTHGKRHKIQQTFLRSFALHPNVVDVCASLGISRSLLYYWLKNDEQFSVQFSQLSEEQEHPTRRKGQRLSPEQRLEAQDAFLQAFIPTSSVRDSARIAMIDRTIVYYWLKSDEQFSIRYRQIEESRGECET